MAKTVGVYLSERVMAGLVVDHKHRRARCARFPESADDDYALVELPTEGLVQTICEQVMLRAGERSRTSRRWGWRCRG